MDKFLKMGKDRFLRGCYGAAVILLVTVNCGSASQLPWSYGESNGVDEHRKLAGCADCPWEVFAPIGADMSCSTCNLVVLDCINNYPDVTDAYGICFPLCGSSLTEVVAFYEGLCGDLSTVTYNHVVECWYPTVPSECTTDDDFVTYDDPTPAPITPTPEPTPSPVTPLTPSPVTPLTPAPVTPLTPAPVTPLTPAPVTPLTPGPVTPLTPGPVTPLTPAPITPAEPEEPTTSSTAEDRAIVTPAPTDDDGDAHDDADGEVDGTTDEDGGEGEGEGSAGNANSPTPSPDSTDDGGAETGTLATDGAPTASIISRTTGLSVTVGVVLFSATFGQIWA